MSQNHANSKTWRLEFEFKNGEKVLRIIHAPVLTLGRGPKCAFRHGQFEKEIEATFESLAPGDIQKFEAPFAQILIQDISSERFEKREKQWDHIASAETGYDVQSPVLWHFRDGMLLSTALLEEFKKSKLLTTGGTLTWNSDDPFSLVYQSGDDFRSLALERQEHGHLRATMDNNSFVVSEAGEFNKLGKLENPGMLEREPSSKFRATLLGALLTWIVFVFVANMATQFMPEEIVDEVLTEEKVAKVTVDKPQSGKTNKGGGNGKVGGGGVEYTQENDPRGGSGSSQEEAVVADKALFGGGAIMNALSALDEGIQSGKVAVAGVAPIGKTGNSGGILGALASLTGKGTGKGGLGLGGLGTKGFGGGGGGGKGAGFGTGVGNGLGKGDGLRNISFDNDAASVRGGLEKSEVDAVVKENFSQVRYCYNKALRNNPSLQGKLISNFVIGADGSVKTSRVKDSTLGVPEVEDCVKARVATWKFPQPRGGGPVEVSYPFLLKSF